MNHKLVPSDISFRRPLRGLAIKAVASFRSREALAAVPRRVESLAALVDDYVVADSAGTVPIAVDGERRNQGFLQIEAAANPASFTAAGGYDNIFTDLARNPVGVASYNIAPGFEGKLQPQTLMRLNLGVGRELFAQPRADWLQRLAGLAELHYTTTLEDATLVDVPLVETLNVGQTLPLDLDIGNLANRVDVLNAALGLSAEVRSWVVTNGFVAPIRDSPDRGFDFEYNIQLQRLF